MKAENFQKLTHEQCTVWEGRESGKNVNWEMIRKLGDYLWLSGKRLNISEMQSLFCCEF